MDNQATLLPPNGTEAGKLPRLMLSYSVERVRPVRPITSGKRRNRAGVEVGRQLEVGMMCPVVVGWMCSVLPGYVGERVQYPEKQNGRVGGLLYDGSRTTRVVESRLNQCLDGANSLLSAFREPVLSCDCAGLGYQYFSAWIAAFRLFRTPANAHGRKTHQSEQVQ